MRGLTIDFCIAIEIKNMAMNGPGTHGTQKSIESSTESYKTKYDINSRISKDWNTGYLGNLLSNIKEQIFGITLKNVSDIIGQHILLKNDSIVEYGQNPHADYTSSSRKT